MINILDFFQPGIFAKIITLIAIGFYIIFGIVVFTQVRAMAHILKLPHAELIFEAITIINIVASISLFLLAVVIL